MNKEYKTLVHYNRATLHNTHQEIEIIHRILKYSKFTSLMEVLEADQKLLGDFLRSGRWPDKHTPESILIDLKEYLQAFMSDISPGGDIHKRLEIGTRNLNTYVSGLIDYARTQGEQE